MHRLSGIKNFFALFCCGSGIIENLDIIENTIILNFELLENDHIYSYSGKYNLIVIYQ